MDKCKEISIDVTSEVLQTEVRSCLVVLLPENLNFYLSNFSDIQIRDPVRDSLLEEASN